MTAADNKEEPSMDEILSSIRKIINEDDGAQPANVAAQVPEDDEDDDDIIDLDDVVGDDGAYSDLGLDPEPELAPAPIPAAAPAPAPRTAPPAAVDIDTDAIAARATQGSLARLQHAIQTQQAPMSGQDADFQPRGGETVEGLVYQILKPMLREWIDRNLPGIV
ncbi:MAG: DUF2497 domain-containing protein, partial [Pseudomonadota bacterium]